MPKILVTGANGMLGRAYSETISLHHPNMELLNMGRDKLDVCDSSQVLALDIDSSDYIIHCAANVNADFCETHPKVCEQIQVEGTRNIAELAYRSGARILYPQSFLIFNGAHETITESTQPAPLSVYGRCKWQAEQELIAKVPTALVVRMGGFFGGDVADKNFVGKFIPHLYHLIKEGVSSYAVGERVWQPTYTVDLAKNSLGLLLMSKNGIYNMASHGEASFLQLARACVELLGVEHRISIEPASASTIDRTDTAKRPWRAKMDNRRLREEGLDRQRNWRDSLSEYLAQAYFQNMFQEFRQDATPTF